MNRKYWIAATGAALLALSLPLAAQAASVTINVNGSTVAFDQPPIERGGRVYVPLRGVFERLGASVVYSRPNINATGNGHNISLTLGSRNATVDGNNVSLDSPPFLVGSRTLVPLRFVAQALGATVNYNGNTRVVDITGSGVAASTVTTPATNNNVPAAGTNGGPVTLTNLSPARGSTVASNNPTISGNFSQNVDPNSVHIALDGRDITSTGIYVSPTTFQAQLPPLPAGHHQITVTGNAAAGGAFQRQFGFNTGSVSSSTVPTLTSLRVNGAPAADGMQVPGSYTLSGQTIPGATVQIVIGYQTSILNGLIPIGGNTNSQTVQADGNGNFSTTIDSSAIGSPPQYQIVVRSVNPNNGASAQPVQLNVHT
jgi:hypothetical protein